MRRIPSFFAQDLVRAEFHQGGIKCLRLFQLSPEVLGALREEALKLAPLRVDCQDHQGAWTRPFGSVRQFSLFNFSGDLADRSRDYEVGGSGKQFHFHQICPTLGLLIDSLPNLLNVRLNCLGSAAGLSGHEESVFFRVGRREYFRVRFHLPLFTNPECLVELDGERFHFAAGDIYFFHQGCLHAVSNLGQTDRYHLVWDMLLTTEVYHDMFCGNWSPPFHHTPVQPTEQHIRALARAPFPLPYRTARNAWEARLFARWLSHSSNSGLGRTLWSLSNCLQSVRKNQRHHPFFSPN